MHTKNRGFTLIEMMISVGIIAVISSIVAYNHGKFNGDLEITNIAYRVALEARQAQVYGISVLQATGASGQTFNAAYGLRFVDGHDDGLVFFTDVDGNGMYTHSEVTGLELTCGGDECIEELKIGRGNRIKKICNISSSSLSACSTLTNLHSVDILFKRPKTDAVINSYVGTYSSGSRTTACSDSDSNPCAGFAVCLQSPQGKEKQVVILSTGQISVENVAPSGSVCSGA